MAMTTHGVKISTVMVTGANGYIASYIVKELLAKGYIVHACVRDASQESKVQHLTDLPLAKENENLKFFSTGDLETVHQRHAFDIPIQGCDAVIHAATPLNVHGNPEEQIYKPAILSTQELLDCIDRQSGSDSDGDSSSSSCGPISRFVLCSSMSAIAPVPEPDVKDESHWSDPEGQKSRGSWYGAAKTEQELMVQSWAEKKKQQNNAFHYAAICPTYVLGPPLKMEKPTTSGTLGVFKNWCLGSKSNPPTGVPNDSMSFVHVEDCAKMHVAAWENLDAGGRYMSVVESWHWNDILKTIQNYYPQLTFEPCPNPIRATQFDVTRRDSLGVPLRSMETIIQESIDYLKQNGDL